MSPEENGWKKPDASIIARIVQVIGILMLLAVLILTAVLGPDAIPFREFTSNDIVRLVTSAILVSLFIERSIELIVNTWRNSKKAELVVNVTELKRLLMRNNDEATRKRLLQEQIDAEKLLYRFRCASERVALIGALLFGVALSALGVRMVAPLLDANALDELSRGHRNLFAAMDVLISGSLLGGGANGLHKILDLFLKYIDGQRQREINKQIEGAAKE